MGGCATKPKVLKDEAEAPQPAEELTVDVEPVKAEATGEEHKEEIKTDEAEAADGRKSLGNLFKAEAEDNAASVNDGEPKQETHSTATAAEELKPEQQGEKASE